jgi:CBS domain containing-hemolysin-like protein
MSGDLAGWVTHPVTLGLIAIAVGLLFAVIEILLRSLAQLENVRFQGILEEHPGLLGETPGLHLSRLVDLLRWLQMASLGLLWLVVWSVPRMPFELALVMAAALPALLAVVARLVVHPVSEDAVTTLLRLVRPVVGLPLKTMMHLRPTLRPLPAEDEEEEATEAEIQAYLEAGEAAGIFEGEEGEIVESLVDFFDTVVREVMTPRTEMVALPDTDTYRDLLEVFASSHKSRIPVYHETIDRVVGVVHVKNVVKHGIRGSEPNLAELARECLVVPETKPLGELLRDFQRQRQQMAIVVDEYGGTSGLVTLEDILEEIVGEIQDELDPREPPEAQELSPGLYRLQGRAPLEVLTELFGAVIEEEDIDTVGGLVFSRHGTVPEAGTEVLDEPNRLRFTVEEMDERRIVSVTVRQADGAPDPQQTAVE